MVYVTRRRALQKHQVADRKKRRRKSLQKSSKMYQILQQVYLAFFTQFIILKIHFACLRTIFIICMLVKIKLFFYFCLSISFVTQCSQRPDVKIAYSLCSGINVSYAILLYKFFYISTSGIGTLNFFVSFFNGFVRFVYKAFVK